MDQRDVPLNSIPTPPDKPLSRWIKSALGYVIALICLIWVFHGVRVGQILKDMAAINWWWIGLAVICDILGFASQGLRWRLLLRPIGDVSVVQTTQAIYAGLFISEVLPMRFGELARAYLVSRWIPARFSSTIPSILVERLFDGVWMALAIGLTAIFIPLPRDLVEAGDILGIIVLIFTGLFIYVVFHKSAPSKKPSEGALLRKTTYINSPVNIKTIIPNISPASTRSLGSGIKMAVSPIASAIHTPSNRRSTRIEGIVELNLAGIQRETR